MPQQAGFSLNEPPNELEFYGYGPFTDFQKAYCGVHYRKDQLSADEVSFCEICLSRLDHRISLTEEQQTRLNEIFYRVNGRFSGGDA